MSLQRRLSRFGVLLILCLAWLMSGTTQGMAHPGARKPDAIARAKAQLERKQQDIHLKLLESRRKALALRLQEKSALSQLTMIQQAYDRKQIELADSQFRLNKTHQAIQSTKQALSQAQASFLQERALAAARLRAIYEHRDVDYWQALLTAPDLNTFLTRYEYFRHVALQDAAILDSLNQQQARISQTQERYDSQLQVISAVTQNIVQQKQQIQTESQAQASLVQKLRTDRRFYDQYVRQLEEDNAQIEGMLRRLIARQRQQHHGKNAPYLGKGFIWPVHGVITSPFGYRFHPIFHRTMFHAGIDIGVALGTPIVAADTGVVLFCGWYGGYGKAIIIDHGGGLQTLYGHTSRDIVAKGQKVQRGQVIGYSGSTGWSTGPHLHFGVFKNGKPVNPMGYLP